MVGRGGGECRLIGPSAPHEQEHTVSPGKREDHARARASWPEVLTAHEVADYLRVNYLTVLKMTRDGRLPALAIGREYRYLRSEVERLMRGPAAPPASD